LLACHEAVYPRARREYTLKTSAKTIEDEISSIATPPDDISKRLGFIEESFVR